MTEFRYPINRKGARVVADFERVLETMNVDKITPGLYHALTMHGGFIAHFDIHGFRDVFRGRLTELLAGEFYRLDDVETFERRHDLDDSGYSDGLSAKQVMMMIARVGARHRSQVEFTERTLRNTDEVELVKRLAVKHGLTVS
jgi:hypothetical protein